MNESWAIRDVVAIKFETVDYSQGGENETIIFDTAISKDRTGGIGFLGAKRR